MRHDRLPWLATLDAHQFDEPGTGAVYVVRGERTAVVETGSARSASTWMDALDTERISFIFLTHIHLDHAGGAGLLAARHPEATVVVHPRGLRYLAEPERLLERVRIAAPAVYELYGVPVPIPMGRMHAVRDGEVFDLGSGLVVRAVETPGHAPHHTCYVETESGCLFAGDALGNYDCRPQIPLTVPPGFDVSAGLSSLDRLEALDPQFIAYTHFGVADRGLERIAAYRGQLIEWLRTIADLRAKHPEDRVIHQMVERQTAAGLSDIQRQLVAMCVRGALLSVGSGA